MGTSERTKACDVVVIGSGLGGLAAARRLAVEGLRVLVLEKDARAGGTILSYVRSRFRLPRGPLGYANAPLVQEVLSSLGSNPPRAHHRLRYLLFTDEGPFPISLPFRELATLLTTAFPGETGLDEFFGEMRRLHGPLRMGLPAPGTAVEEGWRDPVSRTRAIIKNPLLRRLLLGMGNPEPYATPQLVASWNLVAGDGIFRPVDGVESLARSLLDGLHVLDRRSTGITITGPASKGACTVLTNCPVDEIVLGDERVKGVKVGREFVPCGAVISNADVKTTLLRLLPPGILDRETRTFIEKRKLSPSACQVCLAVDRGVDLSYFSEADVLVETRTLRAEASREDPRSVLAGLNGTTLEISLLSSAGDGTTSGKVLVMRAPSRWEDFSRYRGASGKRHPTYKALKRMVAQVMMERASSLLPGLFSSAEVLDVATPLTFEERGGRYEGAVAGWSWTETGSPTWGEELIITPVEGLYMAGHQAFSTLVSGGIPTSLLTGLRAAEYALAGEGPRPLPRF